MNTDRKILEDIRDRLGDLPHRLAAMLGRSERERLHPAASPSTRGGGGGGRWQATQHLLSAASPFAPHLGGLAQIMANLKNLWDAWKDFQAAWGMNRGGGVAAADVHINPMTPLLPAVHVPPAAGTGAPRPPRPKLPPLPAASRRPLPLSAPPISPLGRGQSLLPPGSVPAGAVPIPTWTPPPLPPPPAARRPHPALLPGPSLARPGSAAPLGGIPSAPSPRPDASGPPALPPLPPLSRQELAAAWADWPALPSRSAAQTPPLPSGLRPSERLRQLGGLTVPPALRSTPLTSTDMGAVPPPASLNNPGEKEVVDLLRGIQDRLDRLLNQGRERDTGQLPPDIPQSSIPEGTQQHLPAPARQVVSRGQVSQRAGPTGETVDKAIEFARTLGTVLKVAEAAL